jgi:antitoxin component YwqK of YwqJK toxin-antitoxin module
MTENILLIFFVIFTITSCNKKTIIDKEIESLEIKPTNFTSVDTIFYKNNKIRSLRLIKTSTEYTDLSFYESGKKKSIGSVKNSQCHDKYIDWYESGKFKWTREYNHGIQIGKSIEYEENGNFKQQFDNDNKESTTYWKNGKPKLKFVENGLHYYFYSNGKFKEKFDRINKDEYFVEYYNENGEIKFSGKYKFNTLYKNNKKYNGEIICYFNNGKISHFEKILNGIPVGKFYSYHGNGLLKFESEVLNGKEVYYKSYYENGKVYFIRDGIKNTFTQWNEQGKQIETTLLQP